MRRLVLAGTLMVGCGFEHGRVGGDSGTPPDTDPLVDSAPMAPWLSTHSYRKPIRITPGGSTAVITDMPIAIRRTADADLAARADASGSDFVLTAADGTSPLAHEVAFFEKSTGEVELWVRVPSLPLDGMTWLFLYYGGPASVPAQIWNSGYRGVWHMSSASGGELDSSSSANHIAQATATFVPGGGPGPGGAGRARAFDGVDDRLTVADPADNSLDVGTSSFAVSIWLHSVQSNGLYDPPFYKGGTNPGNPGYTIFAGTNAWTGKIMDASGTFRNPTFSPTPINGRWAHIAMSIDRANTGGAQWTTYRDGAVVETAVFNLGSFDGTADLIIGQAGANGFQGSIDEVRVYDRTLAADWVATEYANLTSPDFLAFGAQQTK